MADRGFSEVFKNMESEADKSLPDPTERKVIFCNANAITYLKPTDIIPDGSQAGRRVCEYSPYATLSFPGKPKYFESSI